MRVGFAGNQPAGAERAGRPRAPGDLVATSAAWGVSKPDPAFFARMIAELALAREEIAYVGDRVDNDVVPAAAAGLFTVHLRRGPWGIIQAAWPEGHTPGREPHEATSATRGRPDFATPRASCRGV